MANTVEELEAQRQAAQAEADANAEAAATEAQQQAEAQGLSEEEVQQRVEAARKEEKDKLYPKIEELQNSLKEVQEHFKQEREAKEKAEQEAQARAEKARQAKLSEDEKQSELLKRIEEKLDDERKQRTELEARLASKEREAELRTYRENAIRAAGDRIIPELVYGNSEAEIDVAIGRAKSKYEEIERTLKGERGKEIKDQLGRTTSPGTEAFEEEALLDRLPNVDEDKYLSDPDYRNEIQAQLGREYAKATGR